jgi:galactokinase
VLCFNFAAIVLDWLAEYTDYQKGVVFVIEANFSTSGVVNRHHCHILGNEKCREIIRHVHG